MSRNKTKKPDRIIPIPTEITYSPFSDTISRYITEDGRCSCGGYIHHYIKDGKKIVQCGWCQHIF